MQNNGVLSGLVRHDARPRGSLPYAVVLCLLLRLLAPDGYMPGNLLAGELFVLCPNGLPPAVAAQFHHGHARQHAPDERPAHAERFCPIGAVLQCAAIAGTCLDTPAAPKAAQATVSWAPVATAGVVARQYDSRAPPRRPA